MKKKILHIQLLPLLTGVQNVMLHLLQGLDKDEFEIYVASKPGGPLVEEVNKLGYTYLPLPLFVHPVSLLDFAVFFQLIYLCRKHRFDIVHTHSSKPGLLGRIAARLAGVPWVIHTGHGAPFYEGQLIYLKKLYMLLEKIGAGFCDRMVFVNQYHRNFYLGHKMIAADKALTIYNAMSPDLQNEIERQAASRRTPAEIVTVGSVLRFVKEKNVVMSITAAIRVCQARNDVRFTFIGDGEMFELCKMMVKASNLQERILLPGWQSDIPLQLAKFDIFLLYSNYEGLSMSIIEALFAGLPVIATDIPANAELVDDSNGWLVPKAQLQILESELNKIIDSKESFKQKGKMSLIKAKELCSYENFLQGYLTQYRNAE